MGLKIIGTCFQVFHSVGMKHILWWLYGSSYFNVKQLEFTIVVIWHYVNKTELKLNWILTFKLLQYVQNKKQSWWTDLRVSSLQFALSRPVNSCFKAESGSLAPLRSSPVRWEGLDFRADATISQWLSESSQLESLWWKIYHHTCYKVDKWVFLHLMKNTWKISSFIYISGTFRVCWPNSIEIKLKLN